MVVVLPWDAPSPTGSILNIILSAVRISFEPVLISIMLQYDVCVHVLGGRPGCSCPTLPTYVEVDNASLVTGRRWCNVAMGYVEKST